MSYVWAFMAGALAGFIACLIIVGNLWREELDP